jgi:hypothetical protein
MLKAAVSRNMVRSVTNTAEARRSTNWMAAESHPVAKELAVPVDVNALKSKPSKLSGMQRKRRIKETWLLAG